MRSRRRYWSVLSLILFLIFALFLFTPAATASQTDMNTPINANTTPPATAQPVPDALLITNQIDLGTWDARLAGHRMIETRLAPNDYTGFSKLPKAVTFDGRTFAKASWNSDTGAVVWRTDYPIARRCKC